VLGIGVNVAVDVGELPAELHETAGTLGRPRDELEAALAELLRALEHRLAEPAPAALEVLRARDALLDQPIVWQDGEGVGAGIDDAGSLLARLADGRLIALSAGEVLFRHQPQFHA
jgi:BirA family biotin operon repressor/biotin-[acetyl-CoA-carboxylase] ligase